MTYHLMKQIPRYFSEWMPVFGLPLKGYDGFPNAMRNKKILHYHGRFDTEVPPGGGVSEDFWIYESMEDTLKQLAEIQGCDISGPPPRLPDPIGSSKNRNLTLPDEDNVECWEYPDCAGRVAYCLYDGGHGTWPLEHMAELAFWFFYGVEPTQNKTRTLLSHPTNLKAD